MNYATKAQRMGAFIIDDIILGIIIGLCYFISWGLGAVVGCVGAVLYFGICEGSSMHATFGKYIMGIVTVDENGNTLDMGHSFTRSLVRLLSFAIVGCGFIIGLFDDEVKTLHDRIAGTRVITKESLGMANYQGYGNAGYGNAGYGAAQSMQQQGMGAQPGAVQQPVRNTAMQPKLIGVAGRYAGQAYLIAPQGIIMGRDPNVCSFVFDGSTNGISRNHCKIQYNPQTGLFVLTDIGSSYGTFLGNGTRLASGQPVALRPKEQFYLADRSCMFMVDL